MIFGNITLPIRYDGLNDEESSYQTIYLKLVMLIMIASIMNFMGPDMMVILLIVLLLFGAKRLPELARGMGRAVKEFSAAREEVEAELRQCRSKETVAELVKTQGELPSVGL